MKHGMMAIGWDKSKVDGAMHDIKRLYINFYNDDTNPIYTFLKKHPEYAVYVWQVCQYMRPEFPFDVRIELNASKGCLFMEIHATPEYTDKRAAAKVVFALNKASQSTRELGEECPDAFLFGVTVL